MALPAFVQQTSGVATGFNGSVTSTNFTSSVTSGNAILVALVNQGTTTNTTTVSDSSGTNVYTRLKFDTASSYYSAVHICYNVTGGSSFNVTVSDSLSNDADFVAIEISGVVATETVSNVSGTSNSTTTPSISTTATTVNANDILIGVFTCEASPMTYTVGSGYSNIKQATGHAFSYNIATETKVVSATGSYSASMGGQGTSLGASAFIIALSNTALTNNFTSNLTGTLSFSGSAIKRTSHKLTATMVINGAIARLIKLNDARFMATLSFSGNISRAVTKTVSAALGFTGLITYGRSLHSILTATLSFTGAINRLVGKVLAASLGFSGANSQRTSKNISGSLSFTGAISKAVSKLLSGILSFTGATSISRLTNVRFGGALSFLVPGTAIDYVTLQDIKATPATWAGANSVLVSNDTGWRVG